MHIVDTATIPWTPVAVNARVGRVEGFEPDRPCCMFTLVGRLVSPEGTNSAHAAMWFDVGPEDTIWGEAGTEAILIGWPTRRLARSRPGDVKASAMNNGQIAWP